MSNTTPFRLDFYIKSGVAKGYRVTLTHQCLESHKAEHKKDRPELKDDDFIDSKTVEAVENPDFVYPKPYLDKNNVIRIQKNVFVFYKENLARRFSFNGVEVRHYARVVVRRSKIRKSLDIITTLYSAKINEKNRCQPVTKI